MDIQALLLFFLKSVHTTAKLNIPGSAPEDCRGPGSISDNEIGPRLFHILRIGQYPVHDYDDFGHLPFGILQIQLLRAEHGISFHPRPLKNVSTQSSPFTSLGSPLSQLVYSTGVPSDHSNPDY